MHGGTLDKISEYNAEFYHMYRKTLKTISKEIYLNTISPV